MKPVNKFAIWWWCDDGDDDDDGGDDDDDGGDDDDDDDDGGDGGDDDRVYNSTLRSRMDWKTPSPNFNYTPYPAF